MCETSTKPTPLRTARCSAIRPPPGHGYSTGMSHPPKSTILALRARCVALSAVFLRSAATASVIGASPLVGQRCCAYDRECAPTRSTSTCGAANRRLRDTCGAAAGACAAQGSWDWRIQDGDETRAIEVLRAEEEWCRDESCARCVDA